MTRPLLLILALASPALAALGLASPAAAAPAAPVPAVESKEETIEQALCRLIEGAAQS